MSYQDSPTKQIPHYVRNDLFSFFEGKATEIGLANISGYRNHDKTKLVISTIGRNLKVSPDKAGTYFYYIVSHIFGTKE